MKTVRILVLSYCVCYIHFFIYIYGCTTPTEKSGSSRDAEKNFRGFPRIRRKKLNIHNSPATKKAVALSGGEFFNFSKSERTLSKRMKSRRKM